MFIATLTVPYLLAPVICMDEDNVGKSEVIGTLFVASGLITLLQNAIGVRCVIFVQPLLCECTRYRHCTKESVERGDPTKRRN